MDSNPNFAENPEGTAPEPLAVPPEGYQEPNDPETSTTQSIKTDRSSQVGTISAASAPQQPPAPPPPADSAPPRRSRWWLYLVGILLAFILIGGGIVFASYKGWIVIGLEELWGGISRNPYKALVQSAEKAGEVKEVYYVSDLSMKLRSGSPAPDLSKANIQNSLSSASLGVVDDLLSFPRKISREPAKVLGDYITADSMEFAVAFEGKSTEKAVSFQVSYELTNDPELQSFEQYFESLTNSENQVILDSISDLESNVVYIKVSSLETEGENPWIKSVLPESYYKDEGENLQQKLEEYIKKLEKIDSDEYKDTFKVAQNKGVRDINGHKTYLFHFVTSAKKLFELYGKVYEENLDIPEEEDYDIELNLWVGINDRSIYKAKIGFTTKDSVYGSMTVELETTLEYKNVTINIPNDEDTVDSACQHPTLKEIDIIKSYCLYYGIDSAGDSTQSRDSARKIDLKAIQAALEEYMDQQGSYPICESICKTNDSNSTIVKALEKYMPTIPVDPLDPQYYYGYISNSSGSEYRLTCIVENESNSNFELNGLKLYKVGVGNL